jgi:amino-acid N-acetyltransferase
MAAPEPGRLAPLESAASSASAPLPADRRTDPDLAVRAAGDDDLPVIEAAIRRWSEREVLLPLAGPALRAALPDFRVISGPAGARDIRAFGALRRYSPRLAEIRSVVVIDGHRGRGLGRVLIAHLVDEARRAGVARLFVLTRVPRPFERLGFSRVTRESLPEKVYVDCSLCARRDRCDEFALVRELR